MSIYRDKKSGCWRFDFDRYIGGERVRRRFLLPPGWTRTQADAFDRKESAALYALATGIAKPRHTVDEAVRSYLKERVPELKSGSNVERELKAMHDWYAGRAVEELPTICAEYAQDQLGALAPATIKNRIAYLRAACRWAWKRHQMTEHDPGARVVVPTVRNARDTHIDRAEMLSLARACDHKGARAVIRIAWYSGMRLSEIEACRPDTRAGVFRLADTKNGEPRLVPIHPRIRACLGVELPSRYVFGYWFRKAREAIGRPDLHAHDLRHSAASEMIRVGVDLYTVGAVLGHKSQASTQRYSHHATKALTEAVGKMGGKSPIRGPKKEAA